jgi:hypothetical protein
MASDGWFLLLTPIRAAPHVSRRLRWSSLSTAADRPRKWRPQHSQWTLDRRLLRRGVRVALVSLVVTIVGIVVDQVHLFSASHSSPQSAFSNPLLPAPLGAPSPTIHLFSPAAVVRTGVYTDCDGSLSLPSPGVYQCVLMVPPNPVATLLADPCFAISTKIVECEPGNIEATLRAGDPPLTLFVPSIGDYQQRYPYQLRTASGAMCTWNPYGQKPPGSTVDYSCTTSSSKGNGRVLAFPVYTDTNHPFSRQQILSFSKVLLVKQKGLRLRRED